MPSDGCLNAGPGPGLGEVDNRAYTIRDERPIAYDEARYCEDKAPEMTKGDYLRNYEIRLRFISSGCLVDIGYKQIAFTTVEEAMQEINTYVSNPIEESKRWNEKFKL